MAMPADALPDIMTAEALLDLDIPGKTTELLQGHLVVREPPGAYHGLIAVKVAAKLDAFASARRLGHVFAQDTGFLLATNPDTVRAPDAAFVRMERLPRIPARGYVPVPPDLAVEIVSPNDRAGEVLAKVADWLDAGVSLVWVIDPSRREAHVHRADGGIQLVKGDDTLDGEGVLPGFRCALNDLLGND